MKELNIYIMNIIQKVNRSRYTLKEILGEEWNITTFTDFSDQEIEKVYNVSSAKNSTLSSFTSTPLTFATSVGDGI